MLKIVRHHLPAILFCGAGKKMPPDKSAGACYQQLFFSHQEHARNCCVYSLMYFLEGHTMRNTLLLISLIATTLLTVCIIPLKEKNPVLHPVYLQSLSSREYIKKTAKIKYGDTLETLLSGAGVNRRDIRQIVACFNHSYDSRRLLPNQPFSLLYDASMTLQGFEYRARKDLVLRIVRDPEGTFKARKRAIPHKTILKSLNGTVITTLYDAMIQANEKPGLITAFSDIFQWDIDFFTDPRPGDRFHILYTKKFLIDTTDSNTSEAVLGYGRILAAQYQQTDTVYTAIYFDNTPAESGYYDTRGQSFQKAFLKSPLNYRRISSYFSRARRHPILKIVRPHYAVDFAAPSGTPVSAAGDGKISALGYNKGLGNYIKIRHTNSRYVTRYGHLKSFASGIALGTNVVQSQVIGYVGQTGLATGPHLDYAFYDNGRPINPLKIKITSGDPILPRNSLKYKMTRNTMLALLSAANDGPGSSIMVNNTPIYRMH
ncbi:peptidoglycan DD-metalloendopeptidase family protein [candidate division KSB1 bacterium]|nr:peptidoglycan DD-metalloendopeptidase family protein [candidate division KSB1 bacterium]